MSVVPSSTRSPSDASPDPTPKSSVRVATGARLHFGLLDTVAPFGGCGVMVEGLGTQITISPSRHFAVEGADELRTRRIARRLADRCGFRELPRCVVRFEQVPRAHMGLGSGTQLSLAVAEGLAAFLGRTIAPEQLAAGIADRGHRSAVGVHGYFRGGFIAEGDDAPGGSSRPTINPIACRVELPESWRVAVLLPRMQTVSISGDLETAQFTRLRPATVGQRNELRRDLTESLIPAAKDANFDAFTAAIATYNLRSGMLFAAVQGGPYNGAAVLQAVRTAERFGGRGVGQSSWGPGVFAWFCNEQAVSELSNAAARDFEIHVTRVCNKPRRLAMNPPCESPPADLPAAAAANHR